MAIEVNTCDIQISQRDLGLTRDRFTRSLLRQILDSRINTSGWSLKGTFPNPSNIQGCIADFAERLSSGAIANLQDYFAMLTTSGYTIGGRRARSQPLLYLKGHLLPGAEDIGSIGEGIAGYYLENIEHLQFELRPFGVSPDFVFRDLSTNERVLVEVKASLHQGRVPLPIAISLIEILAKTKFIRAGRYTAYVVHVNIRAHDDFELRRLRMVEV